MTDHYDVLVCGAGIAGVAAALESSRPLWTLIGGGVFPKEESERDEADFIPTGADWIRDAVESFEPEANAVVLKGGRRVTYGHLVVALGIRIDWDAIPGLREVLGKPGTGVCSNYSYETVQSTWDAIRTFTGGKAVFTEPITGVKCGGAPQKIMYLAETAGAIGPR